MAQSFSSHDIYQTLYSEIMTLQLKPGDTLRENALCERFGVSRTPIRSVLQELRINGLVEVTPYKSTHVTRLDLDTISQQIYLRVAVEGAVLVDFSAVCTQEQLGALRARNDTMRRVAAQPAPMPEQFYQMDSRMHAFWFAAMHKDHIWQQIQYSQNSYSRFRMLDLVETGNFAEIVAEHDELLRAIESRDADSIRGVIRHHLYGGAARLGREGPQKFEGYFVPGTQWPDS